MCYRKKYEVSNSSERFHHINTKLIGQNIALALLGYETEDDKKYICLCAIDVSDIDYGTMNTDGMISCAVYHIRYLIKPV